MYKSIKTLWACSLMIGAMVLWSSPALAQPANDDCEDAITVFCGDAVSGNTSTANPDNQAFCGTTNTAPGVWYTFTGTGDLVTVSLCGSSYDTKLTIYEGSVCGNLTCVDGIDDACGLQSELTFPSTAGVEYKILVHGFSSSTGSFTMNVLCSPPLTNDVCADAITIACGQTINGSTTGATTDSGTPFCGTGVTSPGVWYTFTSFGGPTTVSLCGGTNYDSKVSVYTGDCGSLTCVTGNDDFCGLQSQVSFDGVAGTQYYILVHGFGGANGPFELFLDCEGDNDNCVDAIPVTCGSSTPGSTIDATTDSGTPFCGTGVTSPGVWYSFTATSGGLATASLCGNASYDSKISVYTGSCGDLDCVTGNDDACSLQSEVTWPVSTGTTYYILVHGFGGSTGDFVLDLTCVAGPDNDACVNAEQVFCGDVVSGSTSAATSDSAPFCGTSNTAPGVWYALVGEGDQVTVSTCNAGTNYDTKLSVYSGSCGNLVCEDGNDDDFSCGFSIFRSSVTFTALPGQVYYILVHGFGSSSGNFELSVECVPLCDVDAVGCPDPVTVDNDPGQCGAVVNYSFPELIAGCDIQWIPGRGTQGPGSFFPVGINTETFEIVDGEGNASKCSFTVTVNDTEPPQIICPSSVIINQVRPNIAIVSWEVGEVSDNCGVTSITSDPPSGTAYAIGTTNTVTITAEDAAGNSAACSFSFTVPLEMPLQAPTQTEATPAKATENPTAQLPQPLNAAAGEGFSVFPNPAHHSATIDLPELVGERVAIQLVNSMGHVVQQQTYTQLGAARQQLDLRQLPTGMYTVRIVVDEATQYTQRLIVE